MQRIKRGKKLNLEKFLIFNQQFVTLIRAGLPILKSLDLLAERLRKEAGLAVSDRIRVRLGAAAEVTAALRAHRGWIADEVLASALEVVEEAVAPEAAPGAEQEGAPAPMGAAAQVGTGTAAQVADVDGRPVHLALTKDGA